MKIIEDNYNKPREVKCTFCQSILGVDPADIHYDNDGDAFITCPLCHHTWHVNFNNFLRYNIVK